MYLEIIQEIESIQRARIGRIDIHSNGNTKIKGPPKGCAGVYFFYTSYTVAELCAGEKAPTKSAVPIANLAKRYGRLNKMQNSSHNGFYLVYNGIGGYSGRTYDLRTRILQEISCTSDSTGSLCIRQTTGINDVTRWRYSYVTMVNHKNDNASNADIRLPWNFEEHASDIEKAWRFHHGWPLLCRY